MLDTIVLVVFRVYIHTYRYTRVRSVQFPLSTIQEILKKVKKSTRPRNKSTYYTLVVIKHRCEDKIIEFDIAVTVVIEHSCEFSMM